ncbi:mechanosensitive ion channel family protein [Psychroflexus halocasei]|uniref:Small-conductance mechanosensitive channel n=1 Tax=Psychroflexus halocasei TaxID=908615 RepID=A0A1H4CAV3_9FLAO|nr:mechanosensitive ion channel family protein [Psychroflexus halocasei]SEA57450.1 Small-conductance mechanosensitive channel [Psychroflexus halocasei]
MDLLIEYLDKIIFIAVVLIVAIILLALNKKTLKWLVERYAPDDEKALLLVRRINSVIIIAVALLAISTIFLSKENYTMLVEKFKFATYIGLVIVFTILVALFADFIVKYNISKRLSQNRDTTNLKFIRYFVTVFIYFLGAISVLYAFPSLRVVAKTALGGAGVLTIIVGFASQEALSNVVGGLFIIAFKPFKIGDIIELSDTNMGTVSDITLRHTVIRNFDNQMIVIPNSVINKERLINYNLNDKKACKRLEISIAYDSDIDLARKIMREACENHPLSIDIRSQFEIDRDVPRAKTAVVSLDKNAITIRVWAWAKNFDDVYDLGCGLNEQIKKDFDKAGIEMAIPYRTLLSTKDASINLNQNLKTSDENDSSEDE